MFPLQDAGKVVGFTGRVLPGIARKVNQNI